MLCRAHGSRVWLLQAAISCARSPATGSEDAGAGDEAAAAARRPTSVVGQAFVERTHAAHRRRRAADTHRNTPTRGAIPGAPRASARVLAVPMLREGDVGRRHRRPAQARYSRSRTAEIRARRDLRRPGGDRDRERAPVQRDQGGAAQGRAAHRRAERSARLPDGDQRRAARHQPVADRRRAGVRGDPRERVAPVRQPDRRRCSATTAGSSTSRRPATGPDAAIARREPLLSRAAESRRCSADAVIAHRASVQSAEDALTDPTYDQRRQLGSATGAA